MKTSFPNNCGQSSLADAKLRLNIHSLWTHLGFPGKPSTSCRCPWRDDHRPSFSVTAAGDLFHDFATGEAGDSVDFFQRATGLSQKAACRKFIELAGGRTMLAPRAAYTPQSKMARMKPNFPDFGKGTVADVRDLSALRKVSREAVILAQARGLLWFATAKGCRAWIVADSAGLNAQARRLDGKLWEHIEAKAWTLHGSWAAWPLGIREAQPFPAIALCEGGPDLLAACHFIVCESREADCAPVAMFGATQRIHADALPLFAGKRIRIFGHADNDGRAGVRRWSGQLTGVAAVVDAFDFDGLRKSDGSAAKDLNDCTSICVEDFEGNHELRRMLP